MSHSTSQQRPPAAPDAAPTQRKAAGPAKKALNAMSASLNAAPAVQRLATMAPNRTGMPDNLKAGVEAMSGMSLDHVRVHRNSSRPAQLNAHAYAQGSDIHLAPGQEQHLPHEAWHVVQQAQGRVKPTLQMKGDVPVNDDRRLEQEADVMGARALAGPVAQTVADRADATTNGAFQPAAGELVAQRTTAVNVVRSQELVKDSEGGGLSGTSFSWDSKFDVDIIGGKVEVTIRINSNVDPHLFQKVWADQVTAQWSNRFMVKADGKNYPIVVNLVQVERGEHYAVKPVESDSALKSGGRAHFGTEDMTTWGIHDTTNVSHEVGHMLGNVDEYGVVKVGSDVRDHLSNPSDTIMAVSQNNPIAKHYYLIKWAADLELKKLNLLKDESKVIPDPSSRLGEHQSSMVSLDQIKSVSSGLKKVGTKSGPIKQDESPPEFLDMRSKLKSRSSQPSLSNVNESDPEDKVEQNKKQYAKDMVVMKRNLRLAKAEFKEHQDSWVVERLVTYIERTIVQYQQEFDENKKPRRWCVNTTGKLLTDIAQAISEKDSEGHRPGFMDD